MPVTESGDASQLSRVPQAGLAQMLADTIPDSLAASAWNLIVGAQRILILAHEHPDPDALGSALGLALALESRGSTCFVACADPVPATYAFLPQHDRVISALPEEPCDLVIALDAGELSRYGNLYTRYQDYFDQATILNIDHHVTSAGCGAVNVIDSHAAATAEILTVLLLNRQVTITRQVAQCLMAGIVTDTRAFEYDATTSRTLLAGAYLLGCGAMPYEIIKPVYRMKPLAKARLWARIIEQTLQTAADGRIVWVVLRQSFLKELAATPDMDDGLPGHLMDIEGVAVAAVLKEQEDGSTRVSLRTTEPFDAAAIASTFGGGGHVRAAGCSIELRPDDAIDVLIPVLERAVDRR